MPLRRQPTQQELDEAYLRMWDVYVTTRQADLEAYAESYDQAAADARDHAEAAERAAPRKKRPRRSRQPES